MKKKKDFKQCMSTDITNYIVSAMKSNWGCLWDASAAGLTLRGVRKVIFKEVTFSLKKELLESGPEGTQNKQRAPTEVLSVAGQSRKESEVKKVATVYIKGLY